ncbi:MAG: hypothetical protein RI580_05720 [Halothece sp. Uz-M2-17]|nr:hypothetical protein [Halothece sp. Uz-M2-17]
MSQLNDIVSNLEPASRKEIIVAASRISKHLIGESQCLLAYYLQGHYQLSSNKNYISYKMKHQSFLKQRKQFWLAEGYSVSCEKRNLMSFFTKKGPKFIGTPDLYVKEINHFEELKTGKPKESDIVQLMLYMAAAPYVYSLSAIPSGQVRYSDGSFRDILPEEITQEFKDEVTQLIGALVSDKIPEPEPSESDCRFCPFNHYCPAAYIENVA